MSARDDEDAAYREDRVLRDGGTVTGTNARQLVVRWPEGPHVFVTLEMKAARAERLAAIRAVKPARRRPRPPAHAVARARAEAAGQRVLEMPDSPPPPPSPRARRWTVRVYYTSEGGDLLAFDAHGLTEPEANALRDANTGREVYVPPTTKRGRGTYVPSPGGPPRNAEKYPDGLAPAAPNHGARLVVLPSQRAEAEVSIADEDGSVRAFLAI